tara:strand:- start:68 stop:301 length:234 start_codon:yes stop_codon:yes gene_type:complete
MEIKVRDRCWDCFGLETTCYICNDTGTIEKWISIGTLYEEIQKFIPSEWNGGEQEITMNDLIPRIADTDLPPENVNI